MSEVEVKELKVSLIDPDSEINVRRQGIEENVEKVKSSIQEHGYWLDQPIIVRPHPDRESAYEYQHVTGQCRLKACLAIGLEEIPAFILELNDDEAIQRSWLENEVRGDLTYSDRAYWTERIYKRYSGEGHTAKEALELAAKYLGKTAQTVMGYYALSVLPEDLKQMVDQEILAVRYADAIVKNTYDASRFGESQESMRERVSWILGLDRNKRDHAVEALKQLKHNASIADLTAYTTEKASQSSRVVQYSIPNDLHDVLLQWGKSRGLDDEVTIISHMVTDVLTKGSG